MSKTYKRYGPIAPKRRKREARHNQAQRVKWLQEQIQRNIGHELYFIGPRKPPEFHFRLPGTIRTVNITIPVEVDVKLQAPLPSTSQPEDS